MVIDKKLNLDRELEYFPDGGLSFAQNIVVSPDGLTIQNEPAIVNFLSMTNIDIVGFIACNEEFVLFGKENEGTESVIYRVPKNGGDTIKCDTNWRHQGGEVFGTFTYNVANELIVAISERNLKSNIDCPLKIINLDRDEYINNANDDIYTLTPEIPHSNIIDINYILGDKIKKGKYNFFIKYFINDNFETSWFPIGVPVFAYDNLESNVLKTINDELIQATNEGTIDESGSIPKFIEHYNIKYGDFYNKDSEFTNNNIKLILDINNKINYTHFKIGYIINTNTSIEGAQSYKFDISTKEIIINKNYEPISVDELTINNFNIYNVNTMCNYKNRLYLANYKEENRNKIVDKIDTSSINIWYTNDNIKIPSITENDYYELRNQWKSKPGRAAVYNFFIHYVYPNGNYTDGIKIGTLDDYAGHLFFGTREKINLDSSIETEYIYYSPLKNTTTNDILNIFDSYVITNNKNNVLLDYLNKNLGVYWWTIEAKFYELYPNQYIENPSNAVRSKLRTIVNSKGDVLYVTPIDTTFNVNKLEFTNIKMYPEFVGYFISYEEPEYIQIGEGFVIPENKDLFDVETTVLDDKWKFYYPEFSIVGGKIDVSRLVASGSHVNKFGNVNIYKENDDDTLLTTTHPSSTGISYGKNNFDYVDKASDLGIYGFNIEESRIVSPNSYQNAGKEGYLLLESQTKVSLNNEGKLISFTAISKYRNLYLSDNKKLISLGYIKYVNYVDNQANNTYGIENVPYNYDFYRCFSSLIYFKNCGIIINQTYSNPLNADSGDEYYPYKGTNITNPFYPHIGIIKYWHETHYPLFLKEINQSPDIIFYSYYSKLKFGDSGESAEQNQHSNLVISPQNVNDLYKLNPVYYDYTGKLLVNYDKRIISNQLDIYNKTVRRSDVIQSESIVNSWRYFRPENYKIITENKGNITNVVGVGNYLFVHCEHSLFLFDVTDSLQALDKNVQLLQPDSFEVAYKEVFTADKGYGGLQDYVSWICDEFGYIFFDRSAKKIYRFDGGQLKDMTEGINDLIKVINPTEIWFGNDRERNRIMTNIRGIDDNIILSYNLIANGWTSTHSYISNYKFIGLKDKLFIPNVDGNNLTITHHIDTEFNKFTLPVGNIDNDGSYKSFIDVVFTNPNYNKIKVLDFITYILNKEPADNFELIQLEIFTNCCYSGVIDISQERKKVSEYKKPYYDFERWNFNWFRNVIDKIENGDMVDRLSGRIHSYTQKIQRGYDNALISGKYVVIRFSFKLMSKQVNIKDIQAYFKP